MKGRSKRNSGGVAVKDEAPSDVYAGAGSPTAKAAKERKRGGKTVGKVAGMKAPMNMGRAPRKSGGRTGSNMNPLSSAAKCYVPAGRNVSGDLA